MLFRNRLRFSLCRSLKNIRGTSHLQSKQEKVVSNNFTSVSVLFFKIDLNIADKIPQELLSVFFRGLKAYLSKWKARGFDNDVKRLVSLLEAGSIAKAEQMVCVIKTLPLYVSLPCDVDE